jgi:hypothetical protein
VHTACPSSYPVDSCGLLNDAISSSGETTLDVRVLNPEFELVCKEAAVAQFEILTRHLSGGKNDPRETPVTIAGLRAEM